VEPQRHTELRPRELDVLSSRWSKHSPDNEDNLWSGTRQLFAGVVLRREEDVGSMRARFAMLRIKSEKRD
jgi:hypothetical protein